MEAQLSISRTVIGALVASLAFSLGLPIQNATARNSPSISPTDLGFQKTETLDSQLRKTITLKDPTTGNTLQTTYSSLGTIEFQTETTASGRILSRRELNAQQEVQERFVPVHTRTIIQSKRPGWIAIEKTTWINGSANTVSYEIRKKTALGQCDTKNSSSQIDQLLADTNWLSFRPETTEASVSLGNNFIAENCASFPHGGVEGLAQALTEGLKTGLSCLARLGPERKMDAAKLLAFLDEKSARKAKIRCGHVGDTTGRGEPDPDHPGQYEPMTIDDGSIANAYFPDSPDFPALQLNLDAEDLKDSEAQAPQTFFHEMLHWLGYYHSDGFDVPYLSQICCFPTKNDIRKTQEHACQLLTDHPDFKGEEYHRRFTQVMDDSFHSNVGLEAAWSASRGQNDTSPLFASVFELGDSYRSLYDRLQWNYREKGSPLYYIVLARASLGSLTPEKKKTATAQVADRINSVYPDGKIKEAALYLGDSLNALINHNAKAFKTSWAKFERIRSSACSQMKKNEKEQFSRATDLALLDFYRTKSLPYSYKKPLINPCP